MNDDFMTAFRKSPRPEFAIALYDSLSELDRRRASQTWTPVATLRRNILAATLAVLVLMLGLVMATSSAQAQIGAMLQRFGLVLVRPMPTPPISPTASSVGSQPQPHSFPLERMGLDEAQRRVPFKIPLPEWLPAGMTLKDAVVGTGPSADRGKAPMSVVVGFGPAVEPQTSPRPGGFIQITEGRVSGGYAVEASKAQEVQIHGRGAVYASGTNQRDGLLSWQDDKFTYVLSASGLGLSLEDLIRIAESIK